MSKLMYSFLFSIVAIHTVYAQNFNTDVVINQGPTASASLNLKNGNGMWHISGPRSYEHNNNLTFFWSDNTTFFPRLTIQDNGNIGIGTIFAHEKLTVNGGIAALGTVNVTTANATYIDYCGTCSASRLLATGPNNSTFGIIKFGSATADASSYRESVIINGDGNVGIGTMDPKGYRLAVAGNAIAESVTVKLQSAWPDYVFKPTYKLPSLTSVKAYIDKNQHLPDMPSGKEVIKEGVNLGEMNKLLLKKVEELTLYLMEEHTRNQKQQQINDDFELRVKEQSRIMRKITKRLAKLESKKSDAK
jgi:hypothetical protein